MGDVLPEFMVGLPLSYSVALNCLVPTSQTLLIPDPRPLVERLGSDFFRRLVAWMKIVFAPFSARETVSETISAMWSYPRPTMRAVRTLADCDGHHGTPYLYLRTTPEGRVIGGGEDEHFVSAKRRDALISEKTRTLVKKFGQLFPDVPLEVAYSWAGTFGETKDGLAYIGSIRGFCRAALSPST
jgi:hypothetical protein